MVGGGIFYFMGNFHTHVICFFLISFFIKKNMIDYSSVRRYSSNNHGINKTIFSCQKEKIQQYLLFLLK
jgi:hypothetical protein